MSILTRFRRKEFTPLTSTEETELESRLDELIPRRRMNRDYDEEIENPYTPNLTRRRNKALRPGGRTITVSEEPLDPNVYTLQIQGRDVGAYDANEGIIEFDPNRIQPETLVRFTQEYWGLGEEDIVGVETVRY